MKKLLTIIFVNLLMLTLPLQSVAANTSPNTQQISQNIKNTQSIQNSQSQIQTPNIFAKAAIAADAQTGQIIYAKNIDTQLPIASMTKMISMAIVIDQIKAGKLKWDDKITITPEISELSLNSELSNVPLISGQAYTVRELFDASIIVSANAAVMALADKIAGNQEKFVNMMKEKLNSWGIKDYHIITSTGLNNEYLQNFKYPGTSDDDENTMTARGMAIVASHIVNDYPEFLEVSKKTTETFGNYEMVNWNLLLPGMNSGLDTEGVDGLKTGTTTKAGACFAGTAVKNNWRVVTVVMNTENGETDKTARFTETKKLMDYAFNNFKLTTISKGSEISKHKEITIQNAKTKTQPLVTNKEVKFITPNNTNYTIKIVKTNNLEAPLNKGTIVQKVEIQNNLGYLQNPLTFELVTKQDVKKANIFVRAFRTIESWF